MSMVREQASFSTKQIQPSQFLQATSHPEEWQALVHEAAWQAMASRPYVWGKFVWCMFDFASAWRNEGDHPGS